MKFMYKKAAELTKMTGVCHEVDHIIPLQGKNISGLHCPLNLQILTKSENSRKGNRYDDEE
jgi:5-methylcytosine-specific restriction endonuclease McrA